jgi:hypothetical protein
MPGGGAGCLAEPQKPHENPSDGPKPPTLAFRQEDVVIGYVPNTDRLIRTRRIVWDDEPVDLTADEARIANTPTPGSTFGDRRNVRAASVREFLRDVLKAEPVLQKAGRARGGKRLQSSAAQKSQEGDRRSRVQATRRGSLFTVALEPAGARAGGCRDRQGRRCRKYRQQPAGFVPVPAADLPRRCRHPSV